MHSLSLPRLHELLTRYQAEPYEPHGGYEQWAFSFFRDRRRVLNPYADLTLQLDVTEARASYERSHAGEPGASFTAFLYWHLLRALAQHPAFDLRCIEDRWYRLHNPPLFFPVAVGGPQRFREVLIEDVRRMEWPEFAARYRQEVERARDGAPSHATREHFIICTFIGNLPGLRITGATLHTPDPSFCEPRFYLGQRYSEGERLLMSFCAKIHHANTDPYVLESLMRDFLARCAGA